MTERPGNEGRRPAAALVLAAVAAVLLALSATGLAREIIFGGSALDRLIVGARQAVDEQASRPPGEDRVRALERIRGDLADYIVARPLDTEGHDLTFRSAWLQYDLVDAELAMFRYSLSRPADAGIAYTRGVFLLENGRFREGLAFFRESLHRDIEHLEDIYRTCMAIFARRYDSFSFIFPEKFKCRRHLALLLRHDGLVEQSIAEYQWCLARDPDSGVLHRELGQAYRAAGRVEPALAEVDAALSLKPGRREWLIDRGEYLLLLGRTDEAMDLCRSLVTLRPTDHEAYILWARCYEQQGNFWEAIRIYREALWRVREKGAIHRMIGDRYLDLGRYTHALDEYRAALEKATSDYSRKFALYRTAICYERMGAFQSALPPLLEADEIRPEGQGLEQPVRDAMARIRERIADAEGKAGSGA